MDEIHKIPTPNELLEDLNKSKQIKHYEIARQFSKKFLLPQIADIIKKNKRKLFVWKKKVITTLSVDPEKLNESGIEIVDLIVPTTLLLEPYTALVDDNKTNNSMLLEISVPERFFEPKVTDYVRIIEEFSNAFRTESINNNERTGTIEILVDLYSRFPTYDNIDISVKKLKETLENVITTNKWKAKNLQVVEWDGLRHKTTVYYELEH